MFILHYLLIFILNLCISLFFLSFAFFLLCVYTTENFNYSLKDVSLPGFSLTDFNLDNRWQQIDKIKKLFQVQFPSRWGLENRVEKKIKKLREKSNKDKKQKNKDKHFWVNIQKIY